MDHYCVTPPSQLKTFEDDFNAERRDRESAHGKFADREKEWMDQLKHIGEDRDRLAADFLVLKDEVGFWGAGNCQSCLTYITEYHKPQLNEYKKMF